MKFLLFTWKIIIFSRKKKQIQTSLIWAALWNEGYRWLPNGLEDYWKAGRLIVLFIRLGDLGWKKARLSYAHPVPVCACRTPQVCKPWALLSDLIPLPNPSLLRAWKTLNLADVAYRTISWVLPLHHPVLVRTPYFPHLLAHHVSPCLSGGTRKSHMTQTWPMRKQTTLYICETLVSGLQIDTLLYTDAQISLSWVSRWFRWVRDPSQIILS